MGYENKLLDVRDLLAMYQNRAQRENMPGIDKREEIKQKMMADAMAEEQLRAAQLANETNKMKLSMLTPTGMPGATNDPYFQGYENYAKAQENDKLLSLMNGGKAYTGIGDFGTVGQGGGGYGRNNNNDNTGGGVTETKDNGQVTVASNLGTGHGMAYVGPENKLDSSAIAVNLAKLYRPEGGTSGQPGSEFNNPYYPTNTTEQSMSASPYNPNDVRDLVAEQNTNRDAITSLTNQAQGMGKMSSATADKLNAEVSTNINKENKKIGEPLEKLTAAVQNEVNDFITGVKPSMDDKLVPSKVQEWAKTQKTKVIREAKVQDMEYSLQNKIYQDPTFQLQPSKIKEKIFGELAKKINILKKSPSGEGRSINIIEIFQKYIPGYQMPLPKF